MPVSAAEFTGISRAANGTVAAATESIRYDSNGYRNSLTDWQGNNTSWTNNSRGLPTAVTFASATTNSQTTNLTYDLSWPNLPHTIAANSVSANFTYDSSGNMLTRKLTDTTSTSTPYSTNGQTRTWTYTYNGTGQLLTAQLPRTDVTAKTTYTYTGGTLTSFTDALSHVTTVTQAQGGGLPKKPYGRIAVAVAPVRLELTLPSLKPNGRPAASSLIDTVEPEAAGMTRRPSPFAPWSACRRSAMTCVRPACEPLPLRMALELAIDGVLTASPENM